MDKITLFEEFRLIERNENEVNGAWRGAHLLLFFLAFVFGSFCTFCFHMLMYLFDEQCVLFPKLLSLTSLRHNVIYDFIPEDKEKSDMLPVDFLSTQWVEKSACYLPTFVPLVSGIFGLVWTAIFLMCSTGSRNLTGLQRPWRVVPPVLVFSLAMSGLCIYSSVMTHYGLRELCAKLGEITGSSTCSYTVNVATLAYERRIRGVFQATRLTVITAWLHTSCWLLSSLLALVRILLAVDFQLVRIKVELLGDMNKMLESQEKQLRTISPGNGNDDNIGSEFYYSFSNSPRSTKTEYRSRAFSISDDSEDLAGPNVQSDIFLFTHDQPEHTSEMSLVPEEHYKLTRLLAYQSVPKDRQFIVKILYDFFDNLELEENSAESTTVSLSTTSSMELTTKATAIARQYGQETISSKAPVSKKNIESVNLQEAQQVAKEIKRHLQERLYRQLVELPIHSDVTSPGTSTSKKRGHIAFESSMNITSEMKRTLEDKLNRVLESESYKEEQTDIGKKSNLKAVGVQTEKQKRDKKNTTKQKVTISDMKSQYIDSSNSSMDSNAKNEKDTQTDPKEKQD